MTDEELPALYEVEVLVNVMKSGEWIVLEHADPEDEAVAVGPFTSEEEAGSWAAGGRGRTVVALWTPEMHAAATPTAEPSYWFAEGYSVSAYGTRPYVLEDLPGDEARAEYLRGLAAGEAALRAEEDRD